MSPALANKKNINSISKSGVNPLLKVLVATGSSGGHIFPALAFLDTLNAEKEIDTLLVLPRRNILDPEKCPGYKIALVSLSSVGFRPGLKNLIAFFNLLKGSLESAYIVLRFRPHIAVGFGSITSLPLIIFARALGAKVLIHEQNVMPGRANRLLAGFSDRIALSFAESSEYLKAYSEKLVFTGNPLRAELMRVDKAKALDYLALEKGKFTILVSGGSQGSFRVNQGFLRAAAKLNNKSAFQVIHITGKRDLAEAKMMYAQRGVAARCFAFLNEMQYAYSACDLIITRAGATTVAEIMFFAVAAIIIPYPYAYRHQWANAGVLEKRGSARIISDDALDTDILQDTLQEFINEPEKISRMRASYADFEKGRAGYLLEQALLLLCQ